VLAEIDAAAIPRILVLNKIDRLEPGSDPNALSRHLSIGGEAFTAPVSAATGEGIPKLLAAG
jgi:50S ribosomal subunit-associated GTPase HflX